MKTINATDEYDEYRRKYKEIMTALVNALARAGKFGGRHGT